MNRIEEFWYCVASQEDLPLYQGHRTNSNTCDRLISLVKQYKEGISKEGIDKFINENNIIMGNEGVKILKIILGDPSLINELRVLVGVSDKRLYLDLSYLVHIYKYGDNQRLVNESREHLLKHDTRYFIRMLKNDPKKIRLASLIATYFVNKGVVEILNTFSNFSEEQIVQVFNNLVFPKETQQMQAKYRGHGAEQAFAKIINACNLSIIPENKHIDPMSGYDPNIDLSNMSIVQHDASNQNCHSIDLVIEYEGRVRVLIQSLIHSSDPGQYGVNKSDETLQIKKLIDEHNDKIGIGDKVYLLGCVDGVGFCENPNGTICRMINSFDDFFQINTLFKIPVFLQNAGFINNVEGIFFCPDFFDNSVIDYFYEEYLKKAKIQVLSEKKIKEGSSIRAGKGIVVFK